MRSQTADEETLWPDQEPTSATPRDAGSACSRAAALKSRSSACAQPAVLPSQSDSTAAQPTSGHLFITRRMRLGHQARARPRRCQASCDRARSSTPVGPRCAASGTRRTAAAVTAARSVPAADGSRAARCSNPRRRARTPATASDRERRGNRTPRHSRPASPVRCSSTSSRIRRIDLNPSAVGALRLRIDVMLPLA